jgi:A/G-specific adenine glycosylase
MDQDNPVKAGKKPSAAKLLAWYDKNRRVLPWRALAGEEANPYHVWLSEIMLQQTTVVTVAPYFNKFIKRWPSVQSLARAHLDSVLQMWAGLGYYRRARTLHETARALARDYDGVFPHDEEGLKALAGVGDYTAAAIRAIAFGQKANVVDGNVERVMARFFAVDEPLPHAKKTLKALAAGCLPRGRFGDYAQGLMDLGAMICTPRSPRCDLCPWASGCLARQKGCAEQLPKRAKSVKKPQKKAFAFVLFDKKGRVFLQKRPEKGLLACMMGVPTTPLQASKPLSWKEALAYAPVLEEWKPLKRGVHHTFTHFELELSVVVATTACSVPEGVWVDPERLSAQALPSVMQKVLKVALQS